MDLYFADLSIPEITDTVFYRSLFAFTFYPVLLALKFSQTASLLLLGVGGFLYFIRRERPILAGLICLSRCSSHSYCFSSGWLCSSTPCSAAAGKLSWPQSLPFSLPADSRFCSIHVLSNSIGNFLRHLI